MQETGSKDKIIAARVSPMGNRASVLIVLFLPVGYQLRLAGRQGLEPRYADPESAVLPLDDLPAKGVETILASEKNSESDSGFLGFGSLGSGFGARLGMIARQISAPALELTVGIKGPPAVAQVP